MLDIKFIRQNPEIVRKAIAARNYKFPWPGDILNSFLRDDEESRKYLQEIEKLRAELNKLAQEAGNLIKTKRDASLQIQKSRAIKAELDKLNERYEQLRKACENICMRIPNIPHESVPVGDATNNKIVKTAGEMRRFAFTPKDHIELAEQLDIIDFKRSAKLSGANFILFKGLGALLERGLINFMLELHTAKHGYREIWPPLLVFPKVMEGTGQLPNLEDDMYYLKPRDELYLIPTAEVPVTNIHREEVLSEQDLPIKYTAYTPCFRREAGSYGSDTRGLMRVHQFDKVELVKFVKPETSYQELESLLYDACAVLDILELPYRVVLLSSGDLSFASAKTYDIELYAPGIDKWLEVSSCSNFEDFQARRANIKFKDKKTGKNHFVHTLNGSGVALPRLVAAILENYQQEDGSILIPEKLRPYLNGREKITK